MRGWSGSEVLKKQKHHNCRFNAHCKSKLTKQLPDQTFIQLACGISQNSWAVKENPICGLTNITTYAVTSAKHSRQTLPRNTFAKTQQSPPKTLPRNTSAKHFRETLPRSLPPNATVHICSLMYPLNFSAQMRMKPLSSRVLILTETYRKWTVLKHVRRFESPELPGNM